MCYSPIARAGPMNIDIYIYNFFFFRYAISLILLLDQLLLGAFLKFLVLFLLAIRIHARFLLDADIYSMKIKC